MNQTLIIYPAIAMFFLTFSVLFYMGFCRLRAIRAREVSIKYYRLYNEGEQTERLQLLSRHVQNLFEVPPLFYLVVLLLFVTGQVTAVNVVLAWLFVASRCLHSFVHLGSNNITRRFFVFGFSGLVLAALWLTLLIGLLRSSG